MPTRAHNLMLAAFVALALPSSACSADYFTNAISLSAVHADVASPGKLDWQVNVDATGNLTKSPTVKVTDPSLVLTLDPKSSPVSFVSAVSNFYDSSTPFTNSGKPTAQLSVDTSSFPFLTQLQVPDRSSAAVQKTVPLTGLINQSLISYTQPGGASGSVPVVFGIVTLKGTNAMGQTVQVKQVSVPIQVNVTVTTGS